MNQPPSRPPPPKPSAAAGAEDDESKPGFIPGKKVGMAELMAKDAEDESLRKYKEKVR